MNDDLLESRTVKKTTATLEVQQQAFGKKNNAGDKDNALSNNRTNSTAFRVLMVDRQAQMKVTLNNLCFLFFLNLIPFVIIVSTFGNKSWFLMAQENNYDYWVNFIFVQKLCSAVSNCFDSPVVYSFFIITFYLGGCNDENLSDDDPLNLCAVIASYAYSGIVATVTTVLGLILHVIHMYQLLKTSLRRDQTRIEGFSSLTIAYFTLFLYVGSPVYWFFASATLINTNSDKTLPSRFGSSSYCYLGAVIFFVILVLWFQRVYRKGIRKTLVDDLLKAEKKFVAEISNESHVEDSSTSTFQNL